MKPPKHIGQEADLYKKNLFGMCLNKEAQKSFIGKAQAMAYRKSVRIRFKRQPNNTFFKFGNGVFEAISRITIRTPIPDSGTICNKS